MLNRRFFISWIFASIVMYTLFYAWHGILLNDFSRLNYHKSIFLVFAAVVYILIGGVMAKLMEIHFFERFFLHKQLLKGVIMGISCGAILFMISTVIGVSFNTGSGLKNLVFDLAWQMIEQGIGGGVIGVVYVSRKAFQRDQ